MSNKLKTIIIKQFVLKSKDPHINENLTQFLSFSGGLKENEKEFQAAAMAGITDEIDVDNAFLKVMTRTAKKNRIRKLVLQVSRVAAILFIPLFAYTLWNLYNRISEKQEIQQFAQQEFNSPVGMRSNVILPDGTRVWLNAESKIRYSVPFTGKNRKVYLEGQAFLNVNHVKNSSFLVNVSNIEIEVTGTSFDVKAYQDDDYVAIALKEGSVKLSANDGVQTKSAEMTAGDFFTVEKGTNNIQRKNDSVDKQIAWHDNILVLNETPLEEVAVLLERWYGVKVFITDSKLKKYKFTTTFENEPLNRVLELLELSSPSLKISYKPGKLNRNPGEKNYSVVTISKK